MDDNICADLMECGNSLEDTTEQLRDILMQTSIENAEETPSEEELPKEKPLYPWDNIKFTSNEYDASLGCYQYYVFGNKKHKIEKLYCMSVFQLYNTREGYVVNKTYNKYAMYLPISVDAIVNYSDWNVRIYMDESILSEDNPDRDRWVEALEKLYAMREKVQLICVRMPRYFDQKSKSHNGLLAVMFRYLAMFDINTSICLFRDIDNVWNEQHDYFTNLWLGRGEDVCLFLNEKYKRQQIEALTPDDVILEETYYTTILSGMWNIRKPMGTAFSAEIWQRVFAYVESYTDFVYRPEYRTYKYYGIRFVYGFDELALTRIMMPILINMGLRFYAIPIKIYDVDMLRNLFESPGVSRFLRWLADNETINTIKDIVVNKYWKMTGKNAGLAQYIVCIITNIYFQILMHRNPNHRSYMLIHDIKSNVYTCPLLMGVGIFAFKNYNKYNWFPVPGKETCGRDIVDKFTKTNERLTLEELTAGSNLEDDDDEDDGGNPYGI